MAIIVFYFHRQPIKRFFILFTFEALGDWVAGNLNNNFDGMELTRIVTGEDLVRELRGIME